MGLARARGSHAGPGYFRNCFRAGQSLPGAAEPGRTSTICVAWLAQLARSEAQLLLDPPTAGYQARTLLSTKIITREGCNALKEELDHLWRVKRPDITQKVTWAASLGDRSENADYQYNKKLLREIDRRVRYLRKRLEDMRVVDYSPEQEGRVFFGAWVEIENEEGETKRFRIVGYDEIYGRMD